MGTYLGSFCIKSYQLPSLPGTCMAIWLLAMFPGQCSQIPPKHTYEAVFLLLIRTISTWHSLAVNDLPHRSYITVRLSLGHTIKVMIDSLIHHVVNNVVAMPLLPYVLAVQNHPNLGKLQTWILFCKMEIIYTIVCPILDHCLYLNFRTLSL